MYSSFKSLIGRIFPKQVLFRYENLFRTPIYWYYKGNRFQCPVCDKKLHRFITLPNEDRLCPSCGSLERNRRLWKILKEEFLNERQEVLDFSPSRCIYRAFKKQYQGVYTSTDLSNDFMADQHYDITQLPVANATYDLMVCYHILEHVEDDQQAMRELYRVLQIGGVCLIQTPFKSGDIYEDFSIRTEAERLKHFGQADHVRIYSVEGLKQRLVSVGFQVEVRMYEEPLDNLYGFSAKEMVLVARKV